MTAVRIGVLILLLSACASSNGQVDAHAVDAGAHDSRPSSEVGSYPEAQTDCSGVDPYGDAWVPLECFPPPDDYPWQPWGPRPSPNYQ